MELKRISFHRNVRKGYLLLAAKGRKTIRVVKTSRTIAKTFKKVKREVMDVVRRYKRSG